MMLDSPARKPRSDSHTHLQSPDALARRYKLLEKLGQGNFGVVFKALDRVTGETVAVKEVDLENSDEDISEYVPQTLGIPSPCF
jgi:serine/threonine-protein kinase 24/25/MST4